MSTKTAVLLLALTATTLYFTGKVAFGGPSSHQLVDSASAANINQVHAKHMDLEFTLDFDNQQIYGHNHLKFEVVDPTVTEVILDVWDLEIYSIMQGEQTLGPEDWSIEEPYPELGQELHIKLNTTDISVDQTLHIKVNYKTNTGEQMAVSWMTPEQTLGKEHPYMFTQCQSIYCRSIAPLQDTPAIKSTYSVVMNTPINIQSYVSGNLTHNEVSCGRRYTTFRMDIPVESYLIAIVAGNLVSEKVPNSDNIYVITEPEMMEKSVTELEDLGKSMKYAQEYLTPYVWGDYKIVILPPAFPLGGMENPLLTFASPTIIVGDKSSVNVANHELAHSWTGNLVTNENWDSFWLNEGFTVFIERKIANHFEGDIFYKIDATVGNKSMYYSMLEYGLDDNYSSLTPRAGKHNPDDAFSTVPYEKGFQLVTYLESLVGKDLFQTWLQSYLIDFSYKSLNVDEFKEHFQSFVKTNTKNSTEILSKIDWYQWLMVPGLPPVTIDFSTTEE